MRTKQRSRRIIVILGQTATGKSALAVRVARKFGGEVVSADSRQVYRGLDIGTGKITEREMRGVPHHLLDIASPKHQFTVARYVKLGRAALNDIWARGKVPIVCGGTGLYIAALLGDIPIPEIPPNPTLRKKLEKKSVQELFTMLKKIDPKRTQTIDRHNPRRLVRAIEIALYAERTRTNADRAKMRRPNANTREINAKFRKSFGVLKIGLTLPSEMLKRKIAIRLFARIREGMIHEAKKLHKKGISWKRMEELGLEYRFLANYLRSKRTQKDRASLIKNLEAAIWQYARRQRTWFKRDECTRWFKPNDTATIVREIRVFLGA